MTRNKRVAFFLICLVLTSMLTVGCDVITKFFTGEDPEQTPAATKPISEQTQTNNSDKDVAMPDDGVVRVNNWILTKKDFSDRIEALQEVIPDFDPEDEEARRLILDEIISQQLMVQDAKARGIDEKKEIQDAVAEFEKTLLVREVAQQLVKDAEVTEREAREFYDNNPDNFRTQEEWRIREIVVPNQLKANELLLRVMRGEDFAAIAKESSTSDSASQGGDLGFIVNVPFFEMANALSSLEEGEVSNVFKGPEGFYIVKVEEKRGGQLRAFEEIKDQLMQELAVLEQQNLILAHIQSLREKADIEIKEENLE